MKHCKQIKQVLPVNGSGVADLVKKNRKCSDRSKPPNTQLGIALLEALIAVLLFSMGMLALAGLQAAMVKNTSDAKYRAEASFVAQQRLGMIWVGTALPAGYAENTDISALLPNGTRTVTVSPERVVTVTVSWQSPGESAHSYSTNARIEGI